VNGSHQSVNLKQIIVAVLLAILLGNGNAFASFESKRPIQFGFLVDDSGSMSMLVGGLQPTDPNRYAVLAVRSMLAVLDDDVSATVLRLNGNEQSDIPITSLRSNRERLENLLSTEQNSELASYRGKSTHCIQGFERLVQTLNAAYITDTPQVAIFLTDGSCEPEGKRILKNFLPEVKSHKDGNFKFYFLRFGGRPYTKQFAGWAREAGGNESLLDAKEPTTIASPLAQAITSSQGYDAEVLTPQATGLKAYEYARVVRLLALAPGQGDRLDAIMVPGNAPELRSVDSGTHQYGTGDSVRWRVVEYDPQAGNFGIQVSGASDWKVVAIPVYDLMLETQIQPIKRGDRCSPGQQDIDNVKIGGKVCLRARLRNHDNQVIPVSEFPGLSLRAKLRDQESGALRDIQLRLQKSGKASGEFVWTDLSEGFHTIDFEAVFTTKTGQSLLRRRRTLQVSSQAVGFETNSCEFGNMKPGETKHCQLRSKGTFAALDMKMALLNQTQSPVSPCLQFTINGQPEGKSFRLEPAMDYKLSATSLPFCGLQSIEGTLQDMVSFKPSRPKPGESFSVVLSIEAALDYQVSVSPHTDEILGGDESDFTPTITTNSVSGAEMALVATPSKDNPNGLALAIQTESGEAKEDEEGAWVNQGKVMLSGEPGKMSITLPLKLEVDTCCPSGSEDVNVQFSTTSNPPKVFQGTIPASITSAGWWACNGWWVLTLLFILLVLLAIWCAYRINTGVKSLKMGLVNKIQLGDRVLGDFEFNDDKMKSTIKDTQAKFKTFCRDLPLKLLIPLAGYDNHKPLAQLTLHDSDKSPLRLEHYKAQYSGKLKQLGKNPPGIYASGNNFFLVLKKSAFEEEEYNLRGFNFDQQTLALMQESATDAGDQLVVKLDNITGRINDLPDGPSQFMFGS
jgi:hypothetical protein